MNVLVVSNLYHPAIRGGYELAAYHTANALRVRGHRVAVLTATATGSDGEPDVTRSLALRPVYDADYWGAVPPAEVERELQRAYLYEPANVRALVEAAELFSPDVVYFWNLAGLGALGLLVGTSALGLPCVLHLMDYYPETIAHLLGEGGADYAAFVNQALRPTVICCSETVRRFVERVGLRSDTRVLHNWVDAARIPVKTEYALGERPLRVVYVGQLLEAKGVLLALEAVARLPPKQRRRVRLDLIGRGEEREVARVTSAITRLRLEETVSVRGALDHRAMLETYREYDALVFATHEREPFAFVPIEAMAAGLVVILGECGGNAETAQDGVNCLMVRRDPESIADALRRLLERPSMLEEIGRAAQRLVVARHDAAAALDVIETTLRTKAGATARRATRADAEVVRALNDIFPDMLPHLTRKPLPASAHQPTTAAGPLRRAWWLLLGEGDTVRKRVWLRVRALAPPPLRRAASAAGRLDRRLAPAAGRVARAGRFVGRRVLTLPRRMARVLVHVLRLDTHFGYIAERLGALDRGVAETRDEVRRIADQLARQQTNLYQLAQRMEALARELTSSRLSLEQGFALLRGDVGGLEGRLRAIGEHLGTVRDKGDATNADLASLVAHLRYIGLLPDAPAAAPTPATEWPLETIPACVVCGAQSFAARGSKQGFTIVECTSCGLLLVNPRLRADSRVHLYTSAYWEQHMRQYHLPTFWERITVDYAVALKRVALLSEFAAGETLLDIGCSNGTFIRRAAEWGFESYGLELTPEQAAEASRLSARPVFAGDLEASTAMLEGRRFDHATMFELIEHIYDPDAFLANLTSVMRDGGRAIVETFRTDSPEFQAKFPEHDDVKPLEHIYMYAERHFETLFARHGLRRVARRYPLGDQHSRVIFILEKER